MKTKSLNKNNWISVLGGVITAISITLILILLFAVFIRFLNIPDSWIFPVNQVIKVISLFFGAWVVIKNTKQKGLIYGLLLGFTYYIINFALFSILKGSFSISINNFYDLILTTLSSGIIGIILVHIFKK